MMDIKIIWCSNKFISILKRLTKVIIFQRGDLKDCLMKSIKLPAVFNKSLASTLNHINSKIQVKLDKSCLKQDKVTFTLKKQVP